jgi:Domain of unknown function (DUF6265)
VPNVGGFLSRFSGLLLLAVVHGMFSSTPLNAQAAALKWMAGCWEYRANRLVVTEQWSVPRAGVMLGAGQTTRGDSTIEYEHTRIFERGGKLVFSAQPSGQAPAEFVADSVRGLSVMFSNPAHDFPQRVIYRNAGPDSLLARVEGQRGGQIRGVDFSYRRVSCTGPR